MNHAAPRPAEIPQKVILRMDRRPRGERATHAIRSGDSPHRLRKLDICGILYYMAETALREYLIEIDRLIERNQLDEAIAHSRYILQIYPKNLKTYRLLGKAYLEAKRFGDAADIFQRVLSAAPDDFISHIGMSIVREDEGNLDAAIWHMERGFETNPANPAIQQELRRLIGRRDGVEPNKVHLTRGALARMYAQGELYTQAIAEVRSALQEESDRPDLEVLLAEMYWRTDQRVEAAEISSRVLEKLPFCLEANRIMAAALQTQGKVDEAATYHRRLASLNPYAAYVESAITDPEMIDPSSIQIDKLDWTPGQPLPAAEPGQPDWAASLGIELDTEEEGLEPLASEVPDWLKSEPDVTPEAAPSEDLEVEASPAPPEPTAMERGEIPDWMEEAGWEEGTGAPEETPVRFSDEELSSLEAGGPVAEGDALPADIPDWLKGVAPSELDTSGEAEAAIPEPDLGLPDWISEPAEGAELTAAPPGEDEDQAEILEEAVAGIEKAPEDEPQVTEPEDLPRWLEEGEPGATDTISSWLGDRKSEDISAPEETPDWKTDAEEPAALAEGEAVEAEEEFPTSAEEPPAWLSGLAEAAQDPTSTEEELADLRRRVERVEPEYESEAPEGAPAAPETEAPDWLREIAERLPDVPGGETPDAEELAAVAEGPEEPSDAPLGPVPEVGEPGLDETEAFGEEVEPEAPADAADWLSKLAEAEPAEALPADEVPDWFDELPEEGVGDDTEAVPAEEIPDWLKDLGQPEVAGESPELEAPDWIEEFEQEIIQEAEQEPDFEGALDWLREPAQDVSPEPEPEEVEAPTESPVAELEIQELAPPEAAEEADIGLPPSPEQALQAQDVAEMDEDEVFKWLEGLAARQGASEEELVTPPEERPEEAPFTVEATTAPALEDLPLPEEPEESLEWLERLAETRGIDADVSLEATSEGAESPDEAVEVPEWLDRMAAEFPSAEIGPTPETEEDLATWMASDKAEGIAEPEVTDLPPFGPSEDEELAEQYPQPVAELDQAPDETRPAPEEPSEAVAEGEPGIPSEPGEMVFEPFEPSAAPPEADIEPRLRAEETLDRQMAPEEAEAPEEPGVDQAPFEEPEWLGRGAEVVDEEPEPTEEPVTMPEWLRTPAEEAQPPTEEAPATEPISEVEPQVGEPAEPPQVEEELVAEVEEFEAAPIPEPETAEPAAMAEEIEAAPSKAAEAFEPLERARQALTAGELPEASRQYAELIKDELELDAVIGDLEAAVDREPEAAALWQVLGDAYLKVDRTSDAIKAYGQGMQATEVLQSARQALAAGDLERAAARYSVLVKRKKDLDTLTDDLELALEKDPGMPTLWQILGDAYMKQDRVSEAIEAYRRGMEAV